MNSILLKHSSDIYQNAFPNWQKISMENDEYFNLYATILITDI